MSGSDTPTVAVEFAKDGPVTTGRWGLDGWIYQAVTMLGFPGRIYLSAWSETDAIFAEQAMFAGSGMFRSVLLKVRPSGPHDGFQPEHIISEIVADGRLWMRLGAIPDATAGVYALEVTYEPARDPGDRWGWTE